MEEPLSPNATAKFDAMKDLPSPPPGLVMVTSSGPAVPYAQDTPRRIARSASSAGALSAFPSVLPTPTCGTTPRIVSPMPWLTCSG